MFLLLRSFIPFFLVSRLCIFYTFLNCLTVLEGSVFCLVWFGFHSFSSSHSSVGGSCFQHPVFKFSDSFLSHVESTDGLTQGTSYFHYSSFDFQHFLWILSQRFPPLCLHSASALVCCLLSHWRPYHMNHALSLL